MNDFASREEKFRITDSDWDQGWRYGFDEAVKKALEGYPDGAEVRIEEIRVKKRGDRSFHDYLIGLGS